MNAKRLLKLAEFLDTMPREKFDFTIIAAQGGKPMRAALRAGKTRCGTVGCAIGWMPAVFPRHLKWSSDLKSYPDVCLRSDESATDFSAASKFFDISLGDVQREFTPGPLEYGYSGLSDDATPKQVARHIRAFVRESERTGGMNDTTSSGAPRYFAWPRVWTGKAVARAHVRDRVTGKVVASCPHQHRSRRFGYDQNGRVYRSCESYARRCDEKLLRDYLRQQRGAS